MNNLQYLKIAEAAAKRAGQLFAKSFGKPKDVKMKNGDPRNLVTEVDKAIETQIRNTISKKFPNHKIIGEEFGKQALVKKDFVWIIDPIDGTTNYIQGLPFCCISIALWDEKGPLVAVLYSPVLGQLFTAARGKGSKLNGKPIKISKETKLEYSFGGVGWLKVEQGITLFALLAKNSRKIRVLATSALQICLVAAGNLDFYVTTDIKIWDFAAAVLVLKEAGGTFSDITGRAVGLSTKAILATNGKIHKQLLQKLKEL